MLCLRWSLYLVREAISLARLGSDHRSFEFVLFVAIPLVKDANTNMNKNINTNTFTNIESDLRSFEFEFVLVDSVKNIL